MKYNYKYWINKLRLQKHPEGGYFREDIRSNEKIINEYLPKRYGKIGKRSLYTCIYYLIKENERSSFHKLKSDEIWIYLYGKPITIYIISNNNKLKKIKLGTNIDQKEKLITHIQKDNWFAASLNDKSSGSFALVSCIVVPGFEFDDFLLGNRKYLLKKYNKNKKLILDHTRE